MTTIIFGEPWDAPICDGADVLPETPTYAACLHCGEQIAEGDQGFIRPIFGSVDAQFLVGAGKGYALTATHRECDLAGVVGHLVGVCSCTEWDPMARATGREVLRRVQAGALHEIAMMGDGETPTG